MLEFSRIISGRSKQYSPHQQRQEEAVSAFQPGLRIRLGFPGSWSDPPEKVRTGSKTLLLRPRLLLKKFIILMLNKSPDGLTYRADVSTSSNDSPISNHVTQICQWETWKFRAYTRLGSYTNKESVSSWQIMYTPTP